MAIVLLESGNQSNLPPVCRSCNVPLPVKHSKLLQWLYLLLSGQFGNWVEVSLAQFSCVNLTNLFSQFSFFGMVIRINSHCAAREVKPVFISNLWDFSLRVSCVAFAPSRKYLSTLCFGPAFRSHPFPLLLFCV